MGTCTSSSRASPAKQQVNQNASASFKEQARQTANNDEVSVNNNGINRARRMSRVVSFQREGCKSVIELSEELQTLDLQDALEATSRLLGALRSEKQMTRAEIRTALRVYHELQRVLSVATRTGNLMTKSSEFTRSSPFKERYNALSQEFHDAATNVEQACAAPAAVRPVTLQTIEEVTDFFILDNSLRETTVGARQGHTIKEKHKIVQAMANTGLDEIILGSFGSKIAVDSQIAEHWKEMGESFDSTWGFSDAYDMESYDETELWDSVPKALQQDAKGELSGFFTPPANPKTTYSADDITLLEKASIGFQKDAFGGKSLAQVIQDSESNKGRVPLGLIMMVGYGICNAIVEIDTSTETFDFAQYDIVERCKFLIQWCKQYLPRRNNVEPGQDNTARVLVNLRDFSNYARNSQGLEHALQLVDTLSSLPPDQQPFGFMMEEPTGWLLPDEVARLCRMVRLTMNRAGLSHGRFLVHVHWAFGLAEASTLAALCNGADGVWAAVCRTGAQVGHACSTVTAVNLIRSGHYDLLEKYDLAGMCKAARDVTAITTREPCSTHEEVYGEYCFDIPYFMVNLPACRVALGKLIQQMNISSRVVRLNELSSVQSVHNALVFHFGPPEESGWDPEVVVQMWDAIHNHLLTGLSRDYNSALGLGHLYGLVSFKPLPDSMVQTMLQQTTVSDYHPTVLEFIQRWNKLCTIYDGEELEPQRDVCQRSVMISTTSVTTKPKRLSLPYDIIVKDILGSQLYDGVPDEFIEQLVSLHIRHESKLQGTKAPIKKFYDVVLAIKLFIVEAESLGVLGLVDDFCLRKASDLLFGDKHLFTSQLGDDNQEGLDQQMSVKLLQLSFDHYSQFKKLGNNAPLRLIRATAHRIVNDKLIQKEILDSGVFEDLSAVEAVVADTRYDPDVEHVLGVCSLP